MQFGANDRNLQTDVDCKLQMAANGHTLQFAAKGTCVELWQYNTLGSVYTAINIKFSLQRIFVVCFALQFLPRHSGILCKQQWAMRQVCHIFTTSWQTEQKGRHTCHTFKI